MLENEVDPVLTLADRIKSILNEENHDQSRDTDLEKLWQEYIGKAEDLQTIASKAILFYLKQQNLKAVSKWLKRIGTLKMLDPWELLRIEDRIVNSTSDEIILEETSNLLNTVIGQMGKETNSELRALSYASLAEVNLKRGRIKVAEAQLKSSLKERDCLKNPYLHSAIYKMYSEIMLKKGCSDRAFSMILEIFKHEPWAVDAEEIIYIFKNRVRAPATKIKQVIKHARKKDRKVTRKAGASLVRFRTADNLTLVASYFKPKTPKSPGVILFPMGGNSRQEHNILAKRLTLEGFAVLSVDMRGHGFSISKRVPNTSFLIHSEKGKPFLTKIYEDGKAAVKYLAKRKEVDSHKVAILGSSLSGAIPLPTALECPQVRAVILLSPSIRFWTDRMCEALKVRRDLKNLFIVGREDKPFLDNVEQLFRVADKEQTKKIILKDASHGTEILKKHPELAEVILKWLKESLL